MRTVPRHADGHPVEVWDRRAPILVAARTGLQVQAIMKALRSRPVLAAVLCLAAAVGTVTARQYFQSSPTLPASPAPSPSPLTPSPSAAPPLPSAVPLNPEIHFILEKLGADDYDHQILDLQDPPDPTPAPLPPPPSLVPPHLDTPEQLPGRPAIYDWAEVPS